MTLPETDPHPDRMREVSTFDWRSYYYDGDEPNAYTRAMRERAARAYADELRRYHELYGPKPATFEQFENYARQALNGRSFEDAIALLQRWAIDNPEVARALALFTTEALKGHLSTCVGCGEAIVARPAANSRQYHDDKCRKQATRRQPALKE